MPQKFWDRPKRRYVILVGIVAVSVRKGFPHRIQRGLSF